MKNQTAVHGARLPDRQRQQTFGLAQSDKPSWLDATTFCGRKPPSAGTRSAEMHAGVEQHEDSKFVRKCQKVQLKVISALSVRAAEAADTRLRTLVVHADIIAIGAFRDTALISDWAEQFQAVADWAVEQF